MSRSSAFVYSRAQTDRELTQILEIQKRNTKSGLSPQEIVSEGFVTVVHDLDVLRRMNRACAHIIASLNAQVVGYALAMVPSFRKDLPILAPLFELTDQLMQDQNYLVMGQICIDKPFRGQGVFRGLYQFYGQQLRNEYDCLITEVSVDNQRSMQAHKAVGFETVHIRTEHGRDWEMLVWNW